MKVPRLSEAIIIGSKMRRSARGEFHDTETGGVCAWGAAYVAIGRKPEDAQIIRTLPKRWRRLANMRVTMPEWHSWLPGPETIPLYHAIVALFDQFGWSRPRIARWVATLEPKPRKKKPNVQIPKIIIPRKEVPIVEHIPAAVSRNG